MKTIKRLLLHVFILCAAFASFSAQAAPDANGYTALYECRAGGPNCDVDVVGLTAQACDVTVTTANTEAQIESALNGASPGDVICSDPGDYTGKGTINITASGTSGSRIVFRYTRSGDNDDEPWNQSGANQATFRKILLSGDFWIIHRIRVDANSGEGFSISFGDDNILSRVEAFNGGDNILVESAGTNTLQNFYSHNATLAPGNDSNGVALGGGGSPRVVNCEVKDVPSHGIYTWAGTSVEGAVIENCDVYTSQDMYTDCNGNFTPGDPDSPCAASEVTLSLKASTGSTNVTKVIHNRWWGTRFTDTDICCIDGAGGQIISLSDGGIGGSQARYVLFQNNIVMDGPVGIQHPHSTGQGGNNTHNSVIGNIIYKTNVSTEYINGNFEESYLNTIIRSGQWGGQYRADNSDFLCEVYIDAGTRAQALGSGSQADYNAFYNTSNSIGANKIENALDTRINSTSYPAGTAIQSGPIGNCVAGSESECSIFHTTAGGVSGSSAPTYCTGLGCTFVDGTVTWKKIRDTLRLSNGQLVKRKLRTVAGGEDFVIPRAAMDASAPEAAFCPNTLGCRTGIGVNDDHRAGC
jgi:hypothetical protein